MAFVDAAVNLARPMVAVLAKFLMLPVWTSVAFRATVFTAAVLTLAEAFRAMLRVDTGEDLHSFCIECN